MAFPILPIVALGAGALFLMSGKKKSSGSTYEEYEPESEDLDPGGAGDTETMHFVGDVKFESAQYQGGGPIVGMTAGTWQGAGGGTGGAGEGFGPIVGMTAGTWQGAGGGTGGSRNNS